MALYLLYRARPEDRLPSGLHTVVVQASDEATARALAGISSSWAALALNDIAEGRVIWIEGDAVSVLGLTRGGDQIGQRA
jgi:hypothetical protein